MSERHVLTVPATCLFALNSKGLELSDPPVLICTNEDKPLVLCWHPRAHTGSLDAESAEGWRILVQGSSQAMVNAMARALDCQKLNPEQGALWWPRYYDQGPGSSCWEIVPSLGIHQLYRFSARPGASEVTVPEMKASWGPLRALAETFVHMAKTTLPDGCESDWRVEDDLGNAVPEEGD